MTKTRHTSADVDRGQTTIDFVVGISVFLLVVGFVLGFVPGLFAPFDEDPQRPLVADRVADSLVDGALAKTGHPSVLNKTCALVFLQQSETACGFDPSLDLSEQLGISSSYQVNVSLQRDVTSDSDMEILCTDGAEVERCDPGETPLTVGETVPTDGSTVDSARRIVHVDGMDATVVVTIW